MSLQYLPTNVYEESIKRIKFVFDECDDVIVSMSGGKDSTVMFELAMREATKRGRLPLKVFWLDQEAEWQATEDYMKSIMYREDVKPYWFQIPFDFTNSLSFRDNFLRVWNPADEDKWIRPSDPISIKVNPTKKNRYKDLVNWLPTYCDTEGKEHVGVLVGVRTSESLSRRMMVGFSGVPYKGQLWCKKPNGNTRCFYPIYDYQDQDIWTAIAKNNWRYNRVYDYFYKYGISSKDMRVSALIHETSWHSIEPLQEVEPQMYNRYIQRVVGVNTFSHFKKEIIPRELPPYFVDWKEYRDYLLANLTDPKYHNLFQNRWKNQHGTEWYKIHIKEIMINDIDGTINDNGRKKIILDTRKKDGTYDKEHLEGLQDYFKRKEDKA